MDPVALITTATTDLSGDLGAVAAIGLGVGAGLFALRRGWSVIKGFVK